MGSEGILYSIIVGAGIGVVLAVISFIGYLVFDKFRQWRRKRLESERLYRYDIFGKERKCLKK